MKKSPPSRLCLCRDTLHPLEPIELRPAAGASITCMSKVDPACTNGTMSGTCPQ